MLHLQIDASVKQIGALVRQLHAKVPTVGLNVHQPGAAKLRQINRATGVQPIGVKHRLQLQQGERRILAAYMVSLVVRLVREAQVERIVARLVADAHEVLALAGALVAGTMLVAAVLCSA